MYWSEIRGVALFILIVSLPIWLLTMCSAPIHITPYGIIKDWDWLESFIISYIMAGALVWAAVSLSD